MINKNDKNQINKNDDKTKMMRHKTDLETKKMIKVKNDKLKMIKLKIIKLKMIKLKMI